MRNDLNARQLAALRYLALRPGAAMRAGGGWTADEGVYAFHVDDHLLKQGVIPARAFTSRSYVPTGTANTLAALRRRGLVEFAATPGCFVQARWRITDAGREHLNNTPRRHR